MSGPLIDKFMRDAIASGCTVRVFIRGQSSSVKLEGQVVGRAKGLVHGGLPQPCNAAHISRSRAAVQIRGWAMPRASSWARATLKGRQCS